MLSSYFSLQVTNQPPQLIRWRLRATRHAWRTKKRPPMDRTLVAANLWIKPSLKYRYQ
jgi:hypothetical protein